MKVVILAGGFGTRISEESAFKPKPMIEIGGMPILWHIMKTYSAYGYNEFVICAGYKQHVIKEWFADYFLHTSDITFDYTHGTNEMIVHNKHAEPWRVTVVDTGLNTQTGGRVKRIREYIGNEPFMLTYGDAVGDVNIAELVAFHQAHGKIGTMSMYNFGQNKGVVEVGANSVIDAFREKSDMDGDLINIGFMVFQPELFDLIEGDETVFEKGPLTKLVAQKQLVGYIHQASGSAWTRCGRNRSWSNCGRRAMRRGRCGRNEAVRFVVLSGQESVRDGTYRLQGLVAGEGAPPSRGRCYGVFTESPYVAVLV